MSEPTVHAPRANMLRCSPYHRLFVAAVLVLSGSSVRAMTLSGAMEKVASGIATEAKRLEARFVSVPTPTGPVDDAALSRMHLELVGALKTAFEDRGVPAKINEPGKDADLHVKFEYDRTVTGSSERYAMSVRLLNARTDSLGTFNGNFDEFGATAKFVPSPPKDPTATDPPSEAADEGGKIEVTLRNPSDRVTLEGLTFDATTTGTEAVTNVKLTQALATKSPAFVGGAGKSIVSPREGSLFRIEVLVRREGSTEFVPVPVEYDEGKPFCDLKPGDVYNVRVHNDADFDIAVDLGIDGINMWETSANAAWKKGGVFIVPAASTVTMNGWHFGENGDLGDYREFKVVDFPDSLSAELGSQTAAVGQISAQFFAAWQGATPPAVEGKGARGAATGVGVRVRKETQNVKYNVGRTMLAAITVRYERGTPGDLPAE